ncbi:hypothetical protein ACEWY4_016568 [Coilia grayii]|uniref:Dentin sialophosphoprotein-like n=1 Tax=Coilia grayii TaxID=363190 RepID=A0ABD1JKR8_9TELE
MKAVIVFVLLFASVFCRPVKRSASSSESSEEMVRPASVLRKPAQTLTLKALPPAPAADSDESTETSEETEESNTASDSTDSTDSADTDETETEESISESTESGEAPPAGTTALPVTIVVPTFPDVTDSGRGDMGRGDSMGYSDYKKFIGYKENNAIEKEPSPYKSYADDKMSLNLVSKKAGVFEDGTNDVEKTLKVYKALQVHEDILEEDTSTPEVESQGLDTSSSSTQEEATLKQAAGDEAGLGSSDPAAAEGLASQSDSQSQSQSEEAVAPADGAAQAGSTSADSDGTSESASASQEEEEESESSQSSEEGGATATPGAADSDESEDSEESDSNSEEQVVEPTSEAPIIVITAK